jgi:transcriptional regulator with XRE-family HTH domain
MNRLYAISAYNILSKEVKSAVMSNLGANIRTERRKENYNQRQLAQALGIGQSAISRYENGLREPSIECLKALAITLGCPLSALVCEDKEESGNLSECHINSPISEENIEMNFIRTLLAISPKMSYRVRSFAKRRDEMAPEDWLFLADHIAFAFRQIELFIIRKNEP